MDYATFDHLFPLSNETDLYILEELLKNDKMYRGLLILNLVTVGGEQMVDSIKLMMQKLFKDSFLQNYAYENQGYKNKKNFSQLEICDVLFYAILEQPRYTDQYDEARIKIKTYISQSSYRAKHEALSETPNV